MNLLKTITVVSLVVCSLLSGLASAARVNIENPRIWPAPDHTRLVLDISGEVKHKAFSLANPNRLVLDIQDSRIKDSLKKLKLSGTPVKKIRTATRNGDDVRIVLDLNRKVTVRSFVLKPNDQYGRRLVVDLMELESRSKPVVKKSAEVRQSNRDVVIVVDAGHGGDDPGAIGPGRIKEKNVVLAIAKELKKSLDATRG
jgi:N-acetylmuramoyl-L-alanine amidase